GPGLRALPPRAVQAIAHCSASASGVGSPEPSGGGLSAAAIYVVAGSVLFTWSPNRRWTSGCPDSLYGRSSDRTMFVSALAAREAIGERRAARAVDSVLTDRGRRGPRERPNGRRAHTA